MGDTAWLTITAHPCQGPYAGLNNNARACQDGGGFRGQ
jgi:hypothetical protein